MLIYYATHIFFFLSIIFLPITVINLLASKYTSIYVYMYLMFCSLAATALSLVKTPTSSDPVAALWVLGQRCSPRTSPTHWVPRLAICISSK